MTERAGRDPERRRRESEFFDGLVAEEGDFNPFLRRGWETLSDAFRRAVGDVRDLRVLDVGCGTGRSHEIYSDAAGSYVGVDLSGRALSVARDRRPDARWIRCDAFHLPFPPDSFDLVAFSSVLHHFDEYDVVLREAWRVLGPGGQVFAFDPNVRNPAFALFRHPRSPLYRSCGVSADERPLRPPALRKAFRDAGFDAVWQRCQADIPYRRVAPPGLNLFLGVYNVLDRLLERSGLGRWLGSFVVTRGTKTTER